MIELVTLISRLYVEMGVSEGVSSTAGEEMLLNIIIKDIRENGKIRDAIEGI